MYIGTAELQRGTGGRAGGLQLVAEPLGERKYSTYQQCVLAFLVDEGTMKKATEDLTGLTSDFHTFINQSLFHDVHHLMYPSHVGQ